MSDEQLAQVKSLEGTTMPDGTKYAGEPPTQGQQATKPEPAPAEPEPQGAEEQPDQPGGSDAGENDREAAEGAATPTCGKCANYPAG